MVDLDGGRCVLSPVGRDIARLSVGTYLARTLNFLAFIYIARKVGAQNFGVLEFAGSLLIYFVLLADAGLETWATREIAQARDVKEVFARVVPLRFALAATAFALLLLTLPLLPHYPYLRLLIPIFGLDLFAQAASLKWFLMGRQKMRHAAWGLVVGRVVFLAAIVMKIRKPSDFIWVPVLDLAGDIAMVGVFGRMFVRAGGALAVPWRLQRPFEMLRASLALGTSQISGLLTYNLNSLLLGFLAGAQAVGLYNAAFKPVNVALILSATSFLGLFPTLSRTYVEGIKGFRELVTRSLRLSALLTVPMAVGGTLLAREIVTFLFGSAYADSAAPLRILVWSVLVTILSGSYRQALCASHHQNLDLRCTLASAGVNLGLAAFLIPRYGLVGAAGATAFAEGVAFALAWFYFSRTVRPLNPLPLLARPGAAGVAMGVSMLLARALPWSVRALLGLIAYVGMALVLGEKEAIFAEADAHR
jgi:O-antigen/teichoic acid export membrane protein